MVDTEVVWNVHTHKENETTSCILQKFPENINQSSRFFSFGIHPMQADLHSFEEVFRMYKEVENKKGFVAIGEIGLDTRYPQMDVQESIFILQLKKAEELQKPVILHSVNTWDRCRFLHSEYAPSVSLIYHGFNKARITDHVLAYDSSIFSFGEAILHNELLQNQLKNIPLDKIVIETDTSDVQIIDIYIVVAKLKEITLQQLMNQINKNVNKIFKL